jgi:F-type H+-transporting ATPase subunit delta
LFGLALETGTLDAVKEDLAALQQLTARSSELARFLADYHLSRRARGKLLTNLFSGRLTPLGFRFVMFLEEKRRLKLLDSICASFMQLHDRMNGVVRGRLESAFELDPADITAISDRAEATGTGRVQLALDVKPDLLGGFRLRIGDVIRDFSISGQLRRMRQRLVYG